MGFKRQHDRGFDLTRMHAKAVFMVCKKGVGILTLFIEQGLLMPTHAVDQHA